MKGQGKIRNSGEVLSKLKSRGLRATSLCTYDFSTLCITLLHNLIKNTSGFDSDKLQQTLENINFGLVRMYVPPYRILRVIFSSDLVISYTDKLLLFRWVKIVHLL